MADPTETQQRDFEAAAFRRLSGPAPESRLVVGWRLSPAPDAALRAFLAIATTATVA